MPEAAPAGEKHKEESEDRKRLSNTINGILGVDIDWTQLRSQDLKVLHRLFTDERRLRRLGVRILRCRVKGLGHQAKQEVKGIVRDLITDSGIGDRALKFIAGDDEDADERALERDDG